EGENSGVVWGIRGENQENDRGRVAEAFRERGAKGAIDLPRGQDFTFAGPAFALDKAAGNAPAGIGIFAIVHGEREEIDAFARIGRATRGAEHHVIALADDG